MTKWSEISMRAGSDPQFRARLIETPAVVCKNAGCELPDGISVEVIDEGPDELHLFLGVPTKDAAVNDVLKKAEQDTVLKKALLANPKATLEESTGKKFSSSIRVVFHVPSANSIQLILPPLETREELSEEELESVAGGTFFQRVRDAFCRDQPLTYIEHDTKGNTVAGTGYITTRSGNIQGSESGLVVD